MPRIFQEYADNMSKPTVFLLTYSSPPRGQNREGVDADPAPDALGEVEAEPITEPREGADARGVRGIRQVGSDRTDEARREARDIAADGARRGREELAGLGAAGALCDSVGRRGRGAVLSGSAAKAVMDARWRSATPTRVPSARHKRCEPSRVPPTTKRPSGVASAWGLRPSRSRRRRSTRTCSASSATTMGASPRRTAYC